MTVNSNLPAPIITGPTPVCINSKGNIYSTQSGKTDYLWSISSGGTITAGEGTNSITVTWNSSGNQTVSVNYTNATGCTSPTSSFTILVNECTDDIADLSVVKTADNIYPIIGHNIIFTIVAVNNGPNDATGVIITDILQSGYTYVSSIKTEGTYNPLTGIWTIGNLNIGKSETLTITATVIESISTTDNYVNTAIISGNEFDSDMNNNVSTITTYPTDFFIPEGFSPNGDGINDLFIIRGIRYYPKNAFSIYNRWGNKVYEASPYQNTWDGECTEGLGVGGDKLPTGTYFYILDLGDKSDIIKGTIYLNR